MNYIKGTQAELNEALKQHALWRSSGLRAGKQLVLRGQSFYNCAFHHQDFACVVIQHCKFTECRFVGAKYFDSDLIDVDFSTSLFIDCDFRYTFLENVNFKQVGFTSCNFAGMKIKDKVSFSDVYSLCKVNGDGRYIKSLNLGDYSIAYTATHMQTHGSLKPFEFWWDASDKEYIVAMGLDRYIATEHEALAKWHAWKPVLKRIVELSPAVELLTSYVPREFE